VRKQMRRLKGAAVALCAGLALLCALIISPGARGDTWDKKTTVTFNEAVEIPGQVLQPGTYVFKLLNSSVNRHIVQVWSEDETLLFATIQAIPTERSEPPNNALFEFDERPVDQPVALKTWFYPGDTIGQEFTYSYSTYGQWRKPVGQTQPT
jgi:hypothetical protein